MTFFEGEFKPPIIGSQDVPIKVTGPGYCDVRSDGLMIQGYQQISRVNSSQLFILFFVIFFGLAIVGAFWTEMPRWVMLVPFSVAVYPFMQGKGNDHQGENIELLIPWGNISGTRLDKVSSAVIIRINKFRHQGQRYKGALFFYPSGNSDSLLNALKERLKGDSFL